MAPRGRLAADGRRLLARRQRSRARQLRAPHLPACRADPAGLPGGRPERVGQPPRRHLCLPGLCCPARRRPGALCCLHEGVAGPRAESRAQAHTLQKQAGRQCRLKQPGRRRRRIMHAWGLRGRRTLAAASASSACCSLLPCSLRLGAEACLPASLQRQQHVRVFAKARVRPGSSGLVCMHVLVGATAGRQQAGQADSWQ